MHMNAFRYTGGIPSEILFDNMKQIVIDRKIKASESRFNLSLTLLMWQVTALTLSPYPYLIMEYS
jgi:transposase